METEKIENASFTQSQPKSEEKEKTKEYQDLIQSKEEKDKKEKTQEQEKEKTKEIKQVAVESKKLKLSFVLGFAWVFIDNIFKKWNTEPLTYIEKEAQAESFNVVVAKYVPTITKYVDEINLFDAVASPIIKRFGNRKKSVKSDAIEELEKNYKNKEVIIK